MNIPPTGDPQDTPLSPLEPSSNGILSASDPDVEQLTVSVLQQLVAKVPCTTVSQQHASEDLGLAFSYFDHHPSYQNFAQVMSRFRTFMDSEQLPLYSNDPTLAALAKLRSLFSQQDPTAANWNEVSSYLTILKSQLGDSGHVHT